MTGVNLMMKIIVPFSQYGTGYRSNRYLATNINHLKINNMRTETIVKNWYKFDELSEDAKQKAIEKLYDINVDHDWWDCTYDDAARIGLKLTEFSLYQGRYAKGEFTLSACEVAQNIFNEHGETCETYKTAQNFMNDWQPIFNNYMDESHPDYESGESEDKMNDLESDFLNSLLEDYVIILDNEYDYLTSEKAIIETIGANDYEFDSEGNL